MQSNQNNLAGSAVFWTLGEDSDFARINSGLASAGFSKFTPERMTEYAALKITLEQDFNGCDVFPVRGAGITFEVVRVSRDLCETRNEYTHVVTATADRWGEVKTDLNDQAMEIRLTEAYRRWRATVPYHNVSRALVEIVYALNGTTLRPTGGIYWIPNDKWDRWERVAQAIESAGHKNRVYALRTFLDEHSAAVLREALATEISREARSIDQTLHDPETGLKAASTAKRRANELRRKIASYEEAFEMALPDLKRALDEATGQEARAALMDAASAGPLLLFEVA